MLYREVGQYKTNYAADMAVFPILQDRIGIAVILLVAFVVIPLIGQQLPAQFGADPVSDLLRSRRSGSICSPAIPGLLSLGTGALHGGRRLRLPEADDDLPAREHHRLDPRLGLFSAAVGALFGLPSLRIKGFYLAVATLAAQFFLEWCFIRVPWLFNYSVSGAIEVPLRTHRWRSDHRADRDVGDALSGRAEHCRRDDLVRVEPRARPYRPHVDVGSRHGPRRRAGRHQVAAHQAPRLRRFLVLLRRRRRHDGVPVVRRRRSGRVRHRPEFSGAVHGDHRRARDR